MVIQEILQLSTNFTIIDFQEHQGTLKKTEDRTPLKKKLKFSRVKNNTKFLKRTHNTRNQSKKPKEYKSLEINQKTEKVF